MRALTVRQKPADTPVGMYRVYHNRTLLTCVVVPTVSLSFGLKPSDADIRSAVAETSPGYGVTDTTPIKWEC